MFSVVIPTMWRYLPFRQFLFDLMRFSLVDDIVIIDNDPARNLLKEVELPSTVRVLTKGHNIFCNPAWNWGVQEAKNDKICLLNDDMIFDLRVFNHVNRVLSVRNSLVGMSACDPVNGQTPVTTGEIELVQWSGQNTFGFGQLVFVHRDMWLPIPEQLQLYYGDNWIFDTHRRRRQPIYLITNFLYKTPFAATISEVGGVEKLHAEGLAYTQLMKGV